MVDVNIDFDKASRIINGMNELNTECSSILAASKGIDASAFSSYSPSTVSNNSSIQSSISKLSTLVSKQYNAFKSSIDLYREAYEEEKRLLEELDKTMTKESKATASDLTASATSSLTIMGSVNNGKLLKVKFEGKEYYVANTRINCFTYQKHVESKRLYQNAGLLGKDCLLLSQYYAMDMMRGSYTSRDAMAHGQGSPATRIRSTIKSTSRGPILQYIYNEMLQGRPTALQVTQVNSYKGDRHWVTVVGVSTDVKSYKDLTADKLLVLDCVDGKIQTLSKSRASGGHERDLFAQGGSYLVRGATNNFLNEEVYKR